MKTVKEIVSQSESPAIEIDDQGVIVFVNDLFEKRFGWGRSELMGKPITTIMPPAMRPMHAVGFSRFLSTGKATLLNRPLPLAMQLKDGRVIQADHYITAEQHEGRWWFAATIDLRSNGGAPAKAGGAR